MTTTHVQPDLVAPSLVERFARQAAGELRRNARRTTRHEQRLSVLALLHDSPSLLVEVVMQLTASAPDYTTTEAGAALDSEGG